jgi:hypothetical protein
MSEFDKNIMDFYNFHPGLSHSEEVYFGRTAPLAQILIKHATILKELIEPQKIYKDKIFLGKLYKEIEVFNKEVAKELNAERVQFCIMADDESDNAMAVPIFFRANVYTYHKNGNGEPEKYIDFDKLADLENINIIPNIGYKYADPKGKILIIGLNTGCFKKLTVDEISGTIAHEIGHCFQEGIFGTYKDISDTIIGNEVRNAMNAVNPITNGSFGATIWLVLTYVFFPLHLAASAFKLVSNFFFRLALKSRFSKTLDADTYRMQDELRRLDNGESNELFDDYGNQDIAKMIVPPNNGDSLEPTRDDIADKIFDESKQQMKMYSSKNKKTHLEKKTNALINFFRSINLRLNMIGKAGLRLIYLSDYHTNKMAKLAFYKKYEFFADIFASSYGFGPELYKNIKTTETDIINKFKEYDIVGINKLSLLKAGMLVSRFKEIRRITKADCHGSAGERGRAVYTALVKELEENKTLTTTQKAEIENNIQDLLEIDEAMYQDSKEGGFWCKYYNKIIDDRIKGIDPKTEKEILKPIEEVALQCMKK